MGYFKNVLKRFNATGLNPGEVAIVTELEAHEECQFNDGAFEVVAGYLYDYYISSEIGAQELVDKFIIAYRNNEFKLSDIDTDVEKVDNAIYQLL